MTKSALIVVDVQNDFCEGGALPAADTNSLLEPLHKYIEAARRNGMTIVFTQDWHPPEHSSFTGNDGPWPVHCMAGSKGAELRAPLQPLDGDIIIHKGVEPHGPGYSGFESTELAEQLRRLHVKRVLVTGVATDYCVRATALDALKEGCETLIVSDLVRSVDPQQTQRVLDELQKAGAKIVHSTQKV